jgi:hypothetical protein
MTAKARAGGGAFSPAIMIGLVLIGSFAFAAFFTLSAFAPELSSGRDGRAHALSHSAVGFAGAVKLARDRGDAVRIGRTPGDTARLDGLVVLTPQRPANAAEFEAASGWSTLVVLPNGPSAPTQPVAVGSPLRA